MPNQYLQDKEGQASHKWYPILVLHHLAAQPFDGDSRSGQREARRTHEGTRMRRMPCQAVGQLDVFCKCLPRAMNVRIRNWLLIACFKDSFLKQRVQRPISNPLL